MNAPSIFALLCFTLTPGESVLTVTPQNKTLPSIMLPRVVTSGFVSCGIEANFTLNYSTVYSQWILPNGTALELRVNYGKYFTNQGPVEAPPGFETIILINELIYSDAGTYTCQVRDIRDPDNLGPWMSSEATLQLLVELTADEVEVVIFDNATSVSLSCEMSLYLRPDEDLQWFRGGQLISDTNERYTITYTDGTEQGQFGRDTFGNSRVSTLVISQPQPSDSATYTCAIRNTEQSQNIQLTVESTGGPDPSSSSTITTPTMNTPSMTTPTMSSSSMPTITLPPSSEGEPTIPLPIIIGAVAGVLGITAVILIIIIFFLTHKAHCGKDMAVTTENAQPNLEGMHVEPYYDYVPDKPELPPPRVLLSTSTNPSYGVMQDSAIDTDLNISYGLTQREPNEQNSLNIESRDGLTQAGRGSATQPQSQEHFAYREPSPAPLSDNFLPTEINPSYGVFS